MKEFFAVMGKAFGVVFGSTSALAVVLALFVLAMRPVLRSWAPAQPPTHKQASPNVLRLCTEFDENGKCVDATANEWNLSLSDCSEDGCFVYSRDLIVGYISHKEFTKARKSQPGFTPVMPGGTTPKSFVPDKR